jgi:hypothetical protein
VSTNKNLFAQYYDKLIVVAVLVVLITSLIMLVNKVMQRHNDEENYDSSLSALKQTSESLKPISMGSYDIAAKSLKAPLQLEIPTGAASSFLSPERRVFCVEKTCRKPIPYGMEKCPYCGTEQPKSKVAPGVSTDLDTDGDGIPDKVEIALGLDPKNPDDAKADMDSDGFSNLDEYLAKTDPKDAKSHPALVALLRVKELRAKKMPIVFSNVVKMPDGMKMTFNEGGKLPQTYWVKEGEKIGKTGYEAVKLNYKLERRKDKKSGLEKEYDVSTAVVRRLADKKELTLERGAPAMSTDVEAVIVLPLDNTEFDVVEKGTFKVRDETFRVESLDAATTSVVIVNEATGQEKVVRKLD